MKEETSDSTSTLTSDALEIFIKETYRPSGHNDETPEYISPIDIWDLCNNFFTVSKDDITHTMTQLGFRRKTLEGQPYWIVYST